MLDRGVPVARLSGLEAAAGDDAARRKRLVKAGVVRPGSGDASSLLARPLVKLPASLLDVLDEERKDRV